MRSCTHSYVIPQGVLAYTYATIPQQVPTHLAVINSHAASMPSPPPRPLNANYGAVVPVAYAALFSPYAYPPNVGVDTG